MVTMAGKYTYIYQDYEKSHPHFHKQTINWWPSGRMAISVELENGKRYEFNSFDKTLRRLRGKDDVVDEDILAKEFGANLRKNIPLAGKTQKELCEELDITNAMMSRYLHGKSIPSATKAYKIARALGCTLNELFDDTYL